jgi:hypothetical protein
LFFLPAFPIEAREQPRLVLSPELPREGQQFTLSFQIPRAAPQDVGVEPGFPFPDSVVLTGGPRISALTAKDPVTGTVERLTEVRYVFRAVRAGRSLVGPIPFRVGGDDFFTGDIILELARSRGEALVPFDLAWRTLSSGIYEGQTVAAFLEMRNLREIPVPDAVSISQPGGALFEEVKGLGGISSRSGRAGELFSITVSSWLLTPSAPGRVTLPPARVKALGITVDSAPHSVQARSLPPEVKATGAVGNFTVSSRMDKNAITLGETASLFFRVAGEGNLNYLQPPEMVFPGLVITGRENTAQLEPFESGYRGYAEWEFRLSPRTGGDFSLRVPAFVWMEPETHTVRSSPEMVLSLNVVSRQAAASSGQPAGRPEILRSWDISALEPWNLYSKPYMYAFIIPGAVFFAQGILRKKGKITAGIPALLCLAFYLLGASGDAEREKYLARVDQGAAAYDSENYSQAIGFFLLAAEGIPGSPGVYYNLGLASAAVGDKARAIFYLRGAAVSNPAIAFIRRRLYETEKESGITHGTGAPRIHPDMFFYLFTLFFLAACALPRLIEKKSRLFACLTPVVLAAVFCAGGIFCQAAALGREWAVVSSGGGEMRKVPLPDSSDWLNLAEGTAVDVVSHSGRFVLVAAGSGVEGWMDTEDLLMWESSGGEKNKGERKYGE